MADYCWMLERDAPQKENIKRKKPLRSSLECKRVRNNIKKSYSFIESQKTNANSTYESDSMPPNTL